MNNKIKRALTDLAESVRENLPLVNQKLPKAGASSGNALVYSVAKYYPALNKLAEEK